VLELDHFFLDFPASLREHKIVMAVMSREAEATVELLIDLAAVLNLSVLVLLAVKLSRVVGEILKFIVHVGLLFLLL
jgi:hypothetical protein